MDNRKPQGRSKFGAKKAPHLKKILLKDLKEVSLKKVGKEVLTNQSVPHQTGLSALHTAINQKEISLQKVMKEVLKGQNVLHQTGQNARHTAINQNAVSLKKVEKEVLKG